MDIAGGIFGLLLVVGVLALALALVMAPLKLFSIHKALLGILAELRALRGELAGTCALRKS